MIARAIIGLTAIALIALAVRVLGARLTSRLFGAQKLEPWK